MKIDQFLYGIRMTLDYPRELDELVQLFFSKDESCNLITKAQINSRISIVDSYTSFNFIRKVSNSIYVVSSNEIVYYFNLLLRINVKQINHNEVIISSELLKPQISIFRYIISKIKFNKITSFNDLYLQAIRHSIIYPYFMLMNKFFDTTITHGSSLVSNEKTLCIIGFDGIGKSSILKEFTQQATPVTDNFILFNGTNVFYVPDPLRLLSSNKQEGKIYGKKYEKIDCHINLPKPVFIYTYLGKDYQVVRNTKISFKKLNSLFWDYLPEFYDIKRFSVIFDLIEMEVSFSKDFLDDFNIIEVQRYSLKDNKRLIDELLQL